MLSEDVSLLVLLLLITDLFTEEMLGMSDKKRSEFFSKKSQHTIPFIEEVFRGADKLKQGVIFYI